MEPETTQTFSRGHWGPKLILALISFAAVLGMAEIAVRLVNPPPHVLRHVNVAGYRLSSNPIRKYEYTPGRFDIGAGGFDDHGNFLINRDGFRDHEFVLAKPAHTFRILALGDSVTAGNGVEDYTKTYPKWLERLLNQENSSCTVEVFNMGVGGYHTLQEIETLREAGLPFTPDLVTVGFVINDFDEAVDGGVYANLMNQVGRAEQQVLSDALNRSSWRIKNWLLGKSRLFFFMYYRIRGLQSAFRGHAFNYQRDVLKTHNPVESGLELLNRLQQERGFKVVIFLIPAFDWQNGEYKYTGIHDRLKQAAGRYPDFVVIDLLPAFMASNKNGNGFTYDGLHPNEAGHRKLAELMTPYLRPMLSRKD